MEDAISLAEISITEFAIWQSQFRNNVCMV